MPSPLAAAYEEAQEVIDQALTKYTKANKAFFCSVAISDFVISQREVTSDHEATHIRWVIEHIIGSVYAEEEPETIDVSQAQQIIYDCEGIGVKAKLDAIAYGESVTDSISRFSIFFSGKALVFKDGSQIRWNDLPESEVQVTGKP